MCIRDRDLSGSGANQCSCGFSWLPNQVASAAVSNPSVNEWFNPAAFVTPSAGSFGNEHRNTLIGPNWRDLEMCIRDRSLAVSGTTN